MNTFRYALQRNEDRWFVTPPESEHSYTPRPDRAARFPTREAAQANACGNEHVVDIFDYLGEQG